MKKNSKKGFTLIEMLVSVVIIVMLTIGISTGINAAMKAYTKSLFNSECSTLSDILNATIGDILRYSEDVIAEAGNQNFSFSNYDYNVRNASFGIEDIDGVEGSGGYVIMTYKKDKNAENYEVRTRSIQRTERKTKGLRLLISALFPAKPITAFPISSFLK